MPEAPASRLPRTAPPLGSRLMKTAVALLASLLLSAVLSAQTSSTPTGASEPGTSTPSKDTATKENPPKQRIILRSTPTAPAATPGSAATAPEVKTGAKDATKKVEPAKKPEAQVKGIAIARPNGGFLGLELIESTYKLTFYNAQKLPVAPDVARALLRWSPKGKVTQERYMLNPGEDGKSLSSGRPVRPPYAFKLYITLIKDATSENPPVEPETYTIDFHP